VRQAQRPLTPGWVAGSVRARHMLARGLGRGAALTLARSASLDDALAVLAGSAYGRAAHPGLDLAAAQRAVADTALWHVRVLAGWTPPQALEPVRALVAWFELASIEDRLAYLAGGEVPAPFSLGGLATVWTTIAGAQSAGEVRRALAGSPWGDPGTEDLAGIGLALRIAWARRVLTAVEEAGEWAAGAVALLLARALFLAGSPAEPLAALRPPGVGTAWSQAASLGALREALPPQAGWPLGGVDEPDALWRAEAAWWRRLERDGERLAGAPQMGRTAVVGAVVLLGVDAWRVAGALEAAARGGGPDVTEVLEEIG
jgi:hypothetical protein